MNTSLRSGALALAFVGLCISGLAAAPGTAAGATGGDAARAEVGRAAPDFTLKDTDGKEQQLSRYLAEKKTVVLEWFNPDCPFVRRHHEREKTMEQLFDRYGGKGVVWLAVNSGAPGKQGAGLERNIQARKDYGIAYPVLLDESGRVGRQYGAKTTPHMFVIRSDGVLAYAGAIDDDPRGEKEKAQRKNYVGEALERCLAGKPPSPDHTTSYGCSVKYGPIEM